MKNQLPDYLAGYDQGEADSLAGRDWADNTGKSDPYKDGYARGYVNAN